MSSSGGLCRSEQCSLRCGAGLCHLDMSVEQAQQEVDEEALAEAQEVAAELRGESKLLQEDVAHYKQLAASHGDSSSTSPSRDPAQAQGGAMAAETADARTMVSGAATAAAAMVEEGVPDLRPEVTRLSDRAAVLEAMLEEARTEGRTLRSTSTALIRLHVTFMRSKSFAIDWIQNWW